MTTVKVKFRPSTVANRPGSIIYLVTRHRVVRQITSDCKVFPEEWDERQSKVVLAHKERTNAILSVAHRLSNDMEHLNEVIDRLNHTETDFTTDDVVRCFYESDTNPSLFRFMEDVITHLKHLGRERTSETYTTALRSFMHFRNGEDVYLNEMDSELIMEYQAYLKSRHVSLNTISFYNRILRAVYNRAVEKDLAVQRYPFRHVYTGVEQTAKRAVPVRVMNRIRQLDLSAWPSRELARDLFLFSFYTRGMSFVDMAFLKKKDLRDGILVYRRQKTKKQLSIRWEKPMQGIVARHGLPDSPFLLPIIRHAGKEERRQYLNAIHWMNKALKNVGKMAGCPLPLTFHCARHGWASIAMSQKIPLPVISEAMGHDSEG